MTVLILVSLFFISCKENQEEQPGQVTNRAVSSVGSLEITNDDDYCPRNLVDEYLSFKGQCKNTYAERMNFDECNSLYYSLLEKFSKRYSCATNSNSSILPRRLNESLLLEDKKKFTEEFAHGSEGQLRCGMFTEQEFRLYLKHCPASGFSSVAEAQKCLKTTQYIRKRYPNLECEANIEWTSMLFHIHLVNYSFQKAKEYLILNS